MESPDTSEAETEAGRGRAGEEGVEEDALDDGVAAAAGFVVVVVVVALAAAATDCDEFAGGDAGDGEESGRGAEALVARVLLLLNLNGVEQVNPEELVEACPRARGGRGGTAGWLAAAAAKRSGVVDAEDDDDNAIPRILFFFLSPLESGQPRGRRATLLGRACPDVEAIEREGTTRETPSKEKQKLVLFFFL